MNSKNGPVVGFGAGDVHLLGGVFALDVSRPPEEASPSFLSGDYLAMVNVRSCLYVLLRELQPKRVWMPGYLCESIVTAAEFARANISFYEMGYDLKAIGDDWLEKVQPRDLVVVIAYFGFPADRTICRIAKERGAFVVLDASQALLEQDSATPADYVLYNPRKFLGVPDGGIIQIRTALRLGDVTLVPPDERWWLDALDALLWRRDFDGGNGNREWFPRFRAVEAAQPTGAFSMSELTQRILRWGVDYEEMATRRRENYLALAATLEDIAMFPELPDDVVPLGFPVRVQRRAEVLAKLFENQIFPPIHWSVPDAVPSSYREARQLAADIMTLPCDQRYTPDHMLHQVQILREALR